VPGPPPPAARRRSFENADANEPAAVGPSGRRVWDKGRGGVARHAQQSPAAEDGEADEEDEGKDAVGALLGRDQRHADIHQMHMSLRLNAGGGRGSDASSSSNPGDAESKQSRASAAAAAAGGGAKGQPDDEDEDGEGDALALETLHRTVEDLFEEEEMLLNVHMNVIQENAELLTEEGRLLQQIQGEDVIDYDIDAYAQRLEEILQRKQQLITLLQRRLKAFRRHLQREESVSRAVSHMPSY
jgi:hypothetical protein